MSAVTHPEPHAITRLRERFGLDLKTTDLRRLSSDLPDPIARLDPRRFRFVFRQGNGLGVYIVNFARVIGRECWLTCVINEAQGRFVTVLPVPANLTVRQVDRIMRDFEKRHRGRRRSLALGA